MDKLTDFEKLILKDFIEENWAMFLQHCDERDGRDDMGEQTAEDICEKLEVWK